ncbi:MAG: toluene hydroxylase, partial [Actinomycetes bacterium]
ADSRRREKWSRALVDMVVAQRPENRDVLRTWIERWSVRADEAAEGLGSLIGSGADLVAHARATRTRYLAGLLDPAEARPA